MKIWIPIALALTLAGCGSAPAPAAEPPGLPWVWYAPRLVGPPDAGDTVGLPDAGDRTWIAKLTAAGIPVDGVDIGATNYGAPPGRAQFTEFYAAKVAAGFSRKPCMYARSRGGLQVYNWAAEHPEAVACIAGVYPVGDLRSWPGLDIAAPAYGMSAAELATQLPANNPIDRLAPLAAAGIPIMHLHGDADTLVPLAQNSQVIHDRYVAMGGEMTLKVIRGEGHSYSPLFFDDADLARFLVDHVR